MKLAFLVLAILPASLTVAQQNDASEDTLKTEMEEVVIIGTRSVERIIDIPYSVFKVDKTELSFGRKVSAKDVLADVPGLFLQNRYGTDDLRISMRGFGTRSNSGVRGVRVLQDGIPASEPDGETVIDAVDLSSLGGVEVVKGNLSSLYANAPGGVINFVSDLSFPQSYGTCTNQFGKYGLRQNGFRLGTKGDDSRFLLSYSYRNLDGYRQHSNQGQHLVNSVYEAYLRNATVTVLGNYLDGFSRIPGSLTRFEFTTDPFQADPLAVSQDFRRESHKGRLAVRLKTALGGVSSNELELTGYGGIKELVETDNAVYAVSTRYSLGALIHLTNTTEIIGRKNILTFGMDYAFQSGPVTEFDNQNGNKGLSIQNQYNGSLSNIGFYFLDHFNLFVDRFAIFISGRLDKDVFTRDISIPYPRFTDTSRVFQQFTPKLGLDYKITPSIALYASVGSGYDFPALSELTNTPLSSNIRYSLNPDLKPQSSNNLECGLKGDLRNMESEFMRKIIFEVTFFNYLIKDEIVPFVVSQKTYFRNAARTNRSGIEVAVKSEPFEGIELTTNYIFAQFTYDDYPASVVGPSGVTQEQYAGNVVPSVPRHILNLILNYEFEISENVSGLLQWDCDYISRMYVDDRNSESSPPYFYGNSMAGINVWLGPINAIGYVGGNNIFDKRYAGFISVNDFNGRFYETGEPRNIYSGLNVSYKF